MKPRTWTSPDGKLSITWGGDLQEKIECLRMIGYEYTPTTEDLEEDSDQNRLRNEYIATINTLTNIEDATNPTNAQVVAAVKFIAKTLRLLLKLLKMQYTG